MENLKVLTYENLSVIKEYIDFNDAKSLKTATIEGNVLKLYNVPEPVGTTEPAYEIELPEADLSGLLEKLTGAVEGDVIIANADGTVKDSGVKLDDLATKEALSEVSDIANEAKEALEELNNADTGFIAQAEDYTNTKIQELTEGAVKDNADAIAALKGDAETDGSVAKAIKDATDAINATIGEVEEGKTVVGMIEEVIANGYDDTEVRELIGDVTTLKTTEKDSVVGAINEVSDAVATAVDGAKVTISTDATTEGYLKTYTIKQGETEVGKIDIAKDLVVTAGEVVVNPEGQPEGTYIKLTIANQETPVYVNVKDLVDAYTAQADAAQIQLAISDTNEISATLVAGSVGTTELADDAVVTAKIADKNVTAAKLADDVKELFDEKGSAETALEDAKDYTDEQLANIVAITEAEVKALFATS